VEKEKQLGYVSGAGRLVVYKAAHFVPNSIWSKATPAEDTTDEWSGESVKLYEWHDDFEQVSFFAVKV